MSTSKDSEQDELIRRNAEAIQRNEDALRRQTEALEKIRDHYFPKKTLWKQAIKFVLQVIGVLTLYTSIMEAGEWYWNTRKAEGMAEHCASVAKRLLLHENDAAGAARFLEKAIQLDDGSIRYRIALGYVKGLAAISDLFDLGRPLTPDERDRVDEILADAVYLQEVAPEEPMPYVLAAQARRLRGETEASLRLAEKALALAPENALVRISACALYFAAKKSAEAHRELAEAERLGRGVSFVTYWKCLLALDADHDFAAARKHCDELLRLAPNMALAHLLDGFIHLDGSKRDFAAARAAFEKALALSPKMLLAMGGLALAYEREGNLLVARIWLDRLLELDARHMQGLEARSRVNAKAGRNQAAADDLTAALALDPFRADLCRQRAEIYDKLNDAARAKADRETAAALERANGKTTENHGRN